MPIASSAPARRPSISARGTPKFSSPKSTSSSTTDDTIWLSMSWQTLPAMREMSVRLVSTVSHPSMSTDPKKSPR